MTKSVKMANGNDKLIFPTSMYNTAWGSICICAYLFSEEPVNTNNLKCKWLAEERKIEKGKPSNLQLFHPSDDSFIDDVLEYFDLKRPEYFPIALVKTQYNALFVPYVDGKILPLREDGVPSRTLIYGEVYPVIFNDTNNLLDSEDKDNDKV